MEAQRQGGAVAVFASSAFYANELLSRLHGQTVNGWETSPLAGPRADKRMAVGRSEPGFIPAPEIPCSSAPPLPCSSAQSIIWAEPEQESLERTAQEIVQALAPGAPLYVIVSGWLARFLPEWRAASRLPASGRAGWWRTLYGLRQAGLATEALYGFQTPLSLLWGYSSRALEGLGRADWADRCHFRMRAHYVVRGWTALLAPVGVFVAKKRG
jgi:hypothetical protein